LGKKHMGAFQFQRNIVKLEKNPNGARQDVRRVGQGFILSYCSVATIGDVTVKTVRSTSAFGGVVLLMGASLRSESFFGQGMNGERNSPDPKGQR